jgi:glycosyltransferase involved in cell wall biosynthesis
MKLLNEKGALFYAEYNFRLFLFLLFHRATILVSNDLDTLLANYAASKFKPNAKLVYDSHEYYTEVPELIGRPKIQKIWEGIEGWIFPKLQSVYTVNESIAKLYRDKYKKDVAVVRNISPSWKPTSILSKEDLAIPENKFIIILQGAGINVDRGAEEAVQAMKLIENACLIIVGDGDVIPSLKQNVINYDLSDKVLFFGKRPYSEMMNFTYLSDVGLTLDKPTNMNYQYSLPNKVFDYIHAETPIISTDLVEISSIIHKHSLGLIIDKLSPENLADKIVFLQQNPSVLQELKSNCKAASLIENWEHESKILEQIYPAIGN